MTEFTGQSNYMLAEISIINKTYLTKTKIPKNRYTYIPKCTF